MDRAILHVDCNSYFASVETLLNPELRGRPVAVAGDPESRHGVVVARNELAKQFGVRTTDSVYQAMKKCPDLICVPPHHDKYEEISKRINEEVYLRYSDLVDPYSIDESFIDVTGTALLQRVGLETVADEVRERVKKDIGITVSIGASFNRCFAKLASDMKKPDGTTYIPRKKVGEIILPLPVSNLLYVGKSTTDTLERMGIRTIGDLAASDRSIISSKLGKHGEMIWKYANGLDEEPVRPYYAEREIKSVGNGFTFRRDLVGEAEIRSGVAALADSVAARLRSQKLKCRTIQVQIKDPAFKTIQRQKSLDQPTFLMKEIIDVSMDLISKNWNMKAPIRLITITCTDLVKEDAETTQLSLFDNQEQGRKREKQEKLEAAVAQIRGKHGKDSILYGYTDSEELGIKR